MSNNEFPFGRPALLALADGSLWPGRAFGALSDRTGEIVFNTSQTGYQEVLTDPSYHGQIVVMTQPHIGNYGTNGDDDESARPWVAGFVMRAASPLASNWRAGQTLDAYLAERGVAAITDVDTRALVRHIRTYGAQNAALSSLDPQPERVVALARAAPDMNGLDLVRAVTCAEPYPWAEAAPGWGLEAPAAPATSRRFHVVAYDYGIKRNILRLLVDQDCRVTVVPAETPAEKVLALRPDGVFLSNGPGDPEPCTYAIESIRQVIAAGIPVFGICLGHQLLGLASGAKTVKMKFGHHGANHPVQDLDSGQVMITSQNHGFAVDEASLPPNLRPTHRSLFDNSLQGIERTDCLAFSFQGHPEASPGPHDLRPLFAKFAALMRQRISQQGGGMAGLKAALKLK